MRNRDISLITGIVVAGVALGGPVLAEPAQAATAPTAGTPLAAGTPHSGTVTPAASPSASASGGDVVPINWGALGAYSPGASDPAGQQMAQILANSSRYLATTWYTGTFNQGYAADGYFDLGGNAEQNVRLPAMAALSMATSLKLGVYNAAAAGLSTGDASLRTVDLIRSLAHRHYANNSNSSVATWGNGWQDALWAYYTGQAAWLMWDQLSAQDRDDVARMLATEANRLATGDDVYLTSDHSLYQLYQFKRDGTDVTPGDSKEEEDNWNADVLGLAVAMMPNHQNAQAWQRRNEDLLLASSAKPSDLTDTSVVNGRQLSTWLQGYNIADDGTLQNHDILHPLYMTAFDQSLQQIGAFSLAQKCAPTATVHNVSTVYNALTALKTFQGVDPNDHTKTVPLTLPGNETIYQSNPASAQINYPQGNDWGKQFPAYYGSFDMLVNLYSGADGASAATSSSFESLHNAAELGLQARFSSGQTYVPWNPATTPGNLAENSYVGAEQRIGQISAQAYLADWMQHSSHPACFDNSGTFAPPAVTPPSPTAVSRISGADRYDTGVKVSQAQWSNAGGDGSGRQVAQSVVLARGDDFPDALAGVPLSTRQRGPLLLTEPKALPQNTESEIQRVLPRGKTVYILGGYSAVSQAVEQKLQHDGYTTVRYGGADRFATSLQIATRGMGSPKQVIVATGLNFPDALSAGPLAAAEGNAILLSNNTTLTPETQSYIAGISGDPTFHLNAVGGQAVKATAYLGSQQHTLWGADRYATAAAVANRFSLDMPVTRFGMATGMSYADALTGGAYMANAGQPLLLTDPAVLPGVDAGILGGMQNQLSQITLFGGPMAIHQNVMDAVTGVVRGVER